KINSAEAPGITNTPLEANSGGVFIPQAADGVNFKQADLYSALEKSPAPTLLIFTLPSGSLGSAYESAPSQHRVSTESVRPEPLSQGHVFLLASHQGQSHKHQRRRSQQLPNQLSARVKRVTPVLAGSVNDSSPPRHRIPVQR
ncbi:uncharacterized, partial [Tachysurus ichikawai]